MVAVSGHVIEDHRVTMKLLNNVQDVIAIGRPYKLASRFYKEQFRPSKEYRSGCMLIADEFKTYLESVELKNDEFGKNIKYKHVLSKFDFGLDFNDSFLFYLAKKNNYIIVTDDGDFFVKGLTLNQELLEKSSKM